MGSTAWSSVNPQRAFYGNQYGLAFPVFARYGVQLWVPEVGGAVDPESEADDLVMSVFGGMSKGERNRIKIRVRSAMAAQAQVEGRYLGGRPPYGYRLVDAGPHPNPAKAADGKRLHRLEPDPVAAPIVQRIYDEYLSGIGIFAIAQRLTTDNIPCPSAHDPARNRHRSGIAWSKSAVRAILTNPRYTGHQVCNKQRKQESLIDVEDVALGHHTALKWNAKDTWVYSDQPVHVALVSKRTFDDVQQRLASRGPSSSGRVRTRTRHPYALKGLIHCAICDRRMQGSWNNDRPHYRCRFPTEYAIANKINHPIAVYLREDQVLGPLDTWLATAFAPSQIEHSLATLERTQPDHNPAAQAARQTIAECDRRLASHKHALEAGADPTLIATWTRQVQQERAQATANLEQRIMHHTVKPMTTDQIRDLVNTLGGLLMILREADPTDKTEVYRQLGLKLTYDHANRLIRAEAQPNPHMCVVDVSERGLEPVSTAHLRDIGVHVGTLPVLVNILICGLQC